VAVAVETTVVEKEDVVEHDALRGTGRPWASTTRTLMSTTKPSNSGAGVVCAAVSVS